MTLPPFNIEPKLEVDADTEVSVSELKLTPSGIPKFRELANETNGNKITRNRSFEE